MQLYICIYVYVCIYLYMYIYLSIYVYVFIYLFFLQVCGFSFAGAAIWQYESIRVHAHRILKGWGRGRDQEVGYIPHKSYGFRAQVKIKHTV